MGRRRSTKEAIMEYIVMVRERWEKLEQEDLIRREWQRREKEGVLREK